MRNVFASNKDTITPKAKKQEQDQKCKDRTNASSQ